MTITQVVYPICTVWRLTKGTQIDEEYSPRRHVSALRRTRTDIQATSNDEGYSSALRQIRVPFVSLHTVILVYGIHPFIISIK